MEHAGREDGHRSGSRPGDRRGPGFWTERRVAWYRRALARSDYADRVLETLDPLLPGVRTALDVGAGCGGLALALAERIARVTALEPAPAMARALVEEARARGLDTITVVQAPWGQVAVAPHDLVLCAHVGELLQPGAPFLGQAAAVARRAVVLVRDADPPDADKFFFRELYPALLGRPYGPGTDHRETVDALRALGIAPEVTLVRYRSDQPFADLDEACLFWEDYLGVEGRGARGFLRSFLAPRLSPDGQGWVARYEKRAAVIRWTASAGLDHVTRPSLGGTHGSR